MWWYAEHLGFYGILRASSATSTEMGPSLPESSSSKKTLWPFQRLLLPCRLLGLPDPSFFYFFLFPQHQKGSVFIFLSVRNFPFMLWAVLFLLFISDIILVQERFQGTGCILAKPKNILGENLMAFCSEKLPL